MNRLALRLSTMAALLGGGEPDAWPTIAKDRVYDSRTDDLDANDVEDRLPVVILRTDEDKREMTIGGQGTRDLTFKMLIGVMTAAKDPTTGEIFTGWPATDTTLEAFLDLLEWGVESALFGGGVWANYFRSIWGAAEMNSQPMFWESNEGKVRIAQRELTFLFDGFQMDEVSPFKRESDPAYVPTLPTILRNVFDRIDGQGAGDFKDVCAQLRTDLEAQQLPPAGVYPPLVSVYGAVFMSKVAPPTGDEPAPSVNYRQTLPQ